MSRLFRPLIAACARVHFPTANFAPDFAAPRTASTSVFVRFAPRFFSTSTHEAVEKAVTAAKSRRAPTTKTNAAEKAVKKIRKRTDKSAKKTVKKAKVKAVKKVKGLNARQLGAAKRSAAAAVKNGKLGEAPQTDAALAKWYKESKAADRKAALEKKKEAMLKKKEVLKAEAAKKKKVKAALKLKEKKEKKALDFPVVRARRAARALAKKGELKIEGWGTEQYKAWYKGVLEKKLAAKQANTEVSKLRSYINAAVKKRDAKPDFDYKKADTATLKAWVAAEKERVARASRRGSKTASA